MCGVGQRPNQPETDIKVPEPSEKLLSWTKRMRSICAHLAVNMPDSPYWNEMLALKSIIEKSQGILKRQLTFPFTDQPLQGGYFGYHPDNEFTLVEYKRVNLSYNKIVGSAGEIIAIPLHHAL